MNYLPAIPASGSTMAYSHFNPQPSYMESFYWFTDRLKQQACMIENQAMRERSICSYPKNFGKVHKKLEEFVAAEAVEIIVDVIEQVIGSFSDYIMECAQKWSDTIVNLSFQRLKLWRNLRYQGMCTISQRIPNQYVATTFSGDPASKGECSVKWHNGNLSVLVIVRGYKN
ncbi:uncharacterized protein LOC115224530 [Argonauta hians]